MRPPCTFLVPVFNGSKFLSRIIPNILEMSIPGDEILIINDGSTDFDDSQWAQMESSDFRIRIIHRKHEGIVNSLNEGLINAKNNFIARVDVDDFYSLNRIEMQIGLLLSIENCGLVFSDYKFFAGSAQRGLGEIFSALYPNASILSLVNPQRMPHPAALYLKSAALTAGGYRESDLPCEDYGLWLRMASRNRIASVGESLLLYSISPGSLTSELGNQMRLKVDQLRNEYWSLFTEHLSPADLVEEYFKYDSDNQSWERKILLVRDLLTLSRHGTRVLDLKSILMITADLFRRPLSNVLILIRFATEQRRRRIFREQLLHI